MDLVHGAGHVIALMEHTTKDGQPKLLRRCTLPLTGRAVVHRVITDLALLEVTAQGFAVVELAPGETRQSVQARTEALLVG